MILTYRIDQLPPADRARYLWWGKRDGNLLTIDTTDPRYAMRPPEPVDDTSPEQERRRAQAGGCCGEPAREA